jgi:hypothetical protein
VAGSAYQNYIFLRIKKVRVTCPDFPEMLFVLGNYFYNATDGNYHAAFENNPFVGNGPDCGLNFLQTLGITENDAHLVVVNIAQHKRPVEFRLPAVASLFAVKNLSGREAEIPHLLFLDVDE